MTRARLRRLAAPAAIMAAGVAYLVSGPQAEANRRLPTVLVASTFYAPDFKAVKAGSNVRCKWEAGGFEVHDAARYRARGLAPALRRTLSARPFSV